MLDSTTDLKSLLKDPSLLVEAAYVNGALTDGDQGTFEVTNPARGDVIANVADVRFLNGINGRIPRVYAKLRSNENGNSQVTDKSVTTILLNPTATDTLSKSKFLRLEIGTSPEVLAYQTKVADYLWFSFTPKVNQLPRLMNG